MMTFGNALKLRRGGEWIGGGGEGEPVAPQPILVAYDTNNFTASATELAWGDVPYEDGDLLVMAVMHRAALTTPSGWTLHATVGPFSVSSIDQYTSILTRRMAGAGNASGTVQQASSSRLVVGVLNLRNAGSVIERPDLCFVTEDKRGAFSFTVAGKGSTENLVIWALSVQFWSSSPNADPPYANQARRPWESTPAMLAPVWAAPNDSNQPRLGVFLDYAAAGARTFTSPADNADDYVGVVAIEIANP